MRTILSYLLLTGPTGSGSQAIISDLEAEVAEFNAELEPVLEAAVETPPDAQVEETPTAETCE